MSLVSMSVSPSSSPRRSSGGGPPHCGRGVKRSGTAGQVALVAEEPSPPGGAGRGGGAGRVPGGCARAQGAGRGSKRLGTRTTKKNRTRKKTYRVMPRALPTLLAKFRSKCIVEKQRNSRLLPLPLPPRRPRQLARARPSRRAVRNDVPASHDRPPRHLAPQAQMVDRLMVFHPQRASVPSSSAHPAPILTPTRRPLGTSRPPTATTPTATPPPRRPPFPPHPAPPLAHARAQKTAPPTGSSPPAARPSCPPCAGRARARRRPAGASPPGGRAQSTRRPMGTCPACGRPGAGPPRRRGRRAARVPRRAWTARPPPAAPAPRDGGPAQKMGSPTASCRCLAQRGRRRGGRCFAVSPRRARAAVGSCGGRRRGRPARTTPPSVPAGGGGTMTGCLWPRGGRRKGGRRRRPWTSPPVAAMTWTRSLQRQRQRPPPPPRDAMQTGDQRRGAR